MERFNGTCKGCKTPASILGRRDGMMLVEYAPGKSAHFYRYVTEDGREYAMDNGCFVLDCSCGRKVRLTKVFGKYRADKKCDARCENATGHDCECACGGKHHGRAHTLGAA